MVMGNKHIIQLLVSDEIRGDLSEQPLDRARVLVLNSDYRPISVMPPSVVDWKEAMVKIWNGSIEIVEVYDDIYIQAASMVLKAPAVLRSQRFVRRKHEVHFSRHNVFMRDHYTCQYCGKKGTALELEETFYRIRRTAELTYDHHVARTHGGRTEWDNILTACSPCNERKGSKTKFNAPLRPPRKPTYGELAPFAIQQPLTIPTQKWASYLGWKGPLYVHDPHGDQYSLKDLGHGNYTRGDDVETDESST